MQSKLTSHTGREQYGFVEDKRSANAILNYKWKTENNLKEICIYICDLQSRPLIQGNMHPIVRSLRL